jgi:hypothetical protein
MWMVHMSFKELKGGMIAKPMSPSDFVRQHKSHLLLAVFIKTQAISFC